MQITSLVKLLSEYADLAASLGNPSAAQSLRELPRLFSGQESSTAAKFIGNLSKRKPTDCKIESGTIGDFRRLLSNLRGLLLNAQCKGATGDIELLIDLMEGCTHSSVSQFVTATNSWIMTRQGGLKTGKSGLRKDLIASYIDKLRSSEGQNDLFDQVMRSLRADKQARVAEVREIASKYLGFEIAKKKNKGDALTAIFDHQAFNARQIARGGSQL
jgi:hypothetical protein